MLFSTHPQKAPALICHLGTRSFVIYHMVHDPVSHH